MKDRREVVFMSVLQTIQDRYSVRKFKDTEIEQEKLDRILEAARLAPTAKNQQPQKVYVCKSPKALEAIDAATKCRYGAPVVLVVCYDENEVWHNPFDANVHSGEVDATIVADEMILTAWEEGIASCWVAWFNPSQLTRGLKLQSNIRPVVMIPIGYKADDAEPASRHLESKDLKEMVHEM